MAGVVWHGDAGLVKSRLLLAGTAGEARLEFGVVGRGTAGMARVWLG